MKGEEINKKQTQRTVCLYKQMKHHGELPVTERYLGFTAPNSEENEGISQVKRPKLDLVSTRICEKRRRDKINDRLADLRRLIPASYVKQGKSRIQKVEIIDMAIQHIRDLTKNKAQEQNGLASSLPDRYLGFKECQDEVMRFLVEVENWDAHDKLCNRMMKHLEEAGEKFRIMNDECSNKAAKQDKRPQIQTPFTYLQNKFETSHTFLSASKLGLTLPTTGSYNTSFIEDSSQPSEPGSSNTSSTNKNRQHFDFSGIHYDVNKEPVFMGNNSGRPRIGTRSHDGDCSYKFKRTFAKRFSEDISSTCIKSIDTSSTASKEFTWPSAKRTARNEFTRSECSISPSYSPYQSSSKNNSCTGESTTYGGRITCISSCQPGFVLHPTGSFYIPLSINARNIEFEKYTNEEEEQRCVAFHSVRIPVIFDG